MSTELNHCKAPCWHSLTSAPLSRTNTSFTSIPLLMPCRTSLSCTVLSSGIRGTELAGHLLCWQRQLPYPSEEPLPWSSHQAKPKWQSSMIQQRFGFWLLAVLLFAWQKNDISSFRGLVHAGLLLGLLFDTNWVFRGWSCKMSACFHLLLQQQRSGASSLDKCTMS